MGAPNHAAQLEQQLDLIEYVATALAKSHGLDFNEHCALEADPNGSCDSSTCVAAWNEDHDPSLCRDQYRKDARTALGAINQCSVGYPTLFAVVIAETMSEIQRALVKFPTWPTDPLHAVAVLGEEFGELTKAVLQSVYEPHKVRAGEVRAEAVQTAAMAIRFIASLDACAYAPGDQHSQIGASEVVA